MNDENVNGGCLCGAVRLTVTGAPYRVGVCHCLDCRKHHGAVFCSVCGSSLFGQSGDEVEVHLGCLDAPSQFKPTYELWVIRREEWLPPFDVARSYDKDRETTGRSEP